MSSSELINVTVVPVQAGYKMIFVDPYSDEEIPTEMPETWMADVIGWRVETYKRADDTTYSYTEAITLEGSHNQSYAILCPQGTVDDPCIARYPNMKAFLAAARETQAEAKKHGMLKKEQANG